MRAGSSRVERGRIASRLAEPAARPQVWRDRGAARRPAGRRRVAHGRGILHEPHRSCRRPTGERGPRGGPEARVGATHRGRLRPRSPGTGACNRARAVDAERGVPWRTVGPGCAACRERRVSAAWPAQGRGRTLRASTGRRRHPAARRGLGGFAPARAARRDGRGTPVGRGAGNHGQSRPRLPAGPGNGLRRSVRHAAHQHGGRSGHPPHPAR